MTDPFMVRLDGGRGEDISKFRGEVEVENVCVGTPLPLIAVMTSHPLQVRELDRIFHVPLEADGFGIAG